MRKFATLLLTLLFFLCLPLSSHAADVKLTGRISMVGHKPYFKTALHTADRRTFLIGGPLQMELKNLQGATIKVKGKTTFTEAFYKLTMLEVQSYDLLDVNKGSKPWVGTLCNDDGLYLKTEKGKKITLTGTFAPTLATLNGTKVWVTGNSHTQFFFKRTLAANAFGIIRRAPSSTK